VRVVRIAAVIVISMMAACEKGEETDLPECSHDPELTWDNFGSPFMQQFCNGCHSSLVPPENRNDAPIGVNFDTYHGVLEYRYQIRSVTNAEAPSMPPGGGPTVDQYADLLEWMDCKVDPDGDTLGVP
jgi:hypothetical protein